MKEFIVEYDFVASGKVSIVAKNKRELNMRICQLGKKTLCQNVANTGCDFEGVSSLKINKVNGFEVSQEDMRPISRKKAVQAVQNDTFRCPHCKVNTVVSIKGKFTCLVCGTTGTSAILSIK
jgi:hypothetical protein